MDIVFFDLDGTLLDKHSRLSAYTLETLALLNEKGIVNTVATGRTMISAKQTMGDYVFNHTQIYSNGVAMYDPFKNTLRLENLLSADEINHIVNATLHADLCPFVNTIDTDHDAYQHIIFHPAPRHKIEQQLVAQYFRQQQVTSKSFDDFDFQRKVTNISMIGKSEKIEKLFEEINRHDGLIAYSGAAIEGNGFQWMDVHHRLANKGTAVQILTQQLGAKNIICFGDSYNDISMFNLADEAYAPKNAKEEVKKLASAVIGHHHCDGVAHFLRERFSL